ncbi:hypothetical protein MMC29_001235 [Sticta canariensis]|nr:hypothetical protein [Sticta canariensis]
MSASAENSKTTVPEDHAGKALISCPGHVFQHPVLQNTEPSDMILERAERYDVWLNPMIYHFHNKGNPENEGNHDPSSGRLRNEDYPKPSFHVMLNTMLHMFHLHGMSALQIKCAFEALQCVFSPLFIQGVVGVTTPVASWSEEQRDRIMEAIDQRIKMFRMIFILLGERKSAEEITEKCLFHDCYMLAFGETEEEDELLEGTEDPVYPTEADFLKDLEFFATDAV